MYKLKTEWCPFTPIKQNINHNRLHCVYAHNVQDFRRKPDLYLYEPC